MFGEPALGGVGARAVGVLAGGPHRRHTFRTGRALCGYVSLSAALGEDSLHATRPVSQTPAAMATDLHSQGATS